VPVFGGVPRVRSVYIGSENTYTTARFRKALARAVEIRKEAEERYERAATLARRKAAKEMRAALRAAQGR